MAPLTARTSPAGQAGPVSMMRSPRRPQFPSRGCGRVWAQQRPVTAGAVSVPKFRFPTKTGGALEAEVEKEADGYHITVSIPKEAMRIGPKDSAQLHWGVFRTAPKSWIHPDGVVPPGSELDELTGGMRTPLKLKNGSLSTSFKIPAHLAPITLACTACVPTHDGKVAYAQLRKGLHCSVPIGMEAGKPVPLGSEVSKKGVNFALLSRSAMSVTLVLIRDKSSMGQENTCLEIALDPNTNRTGDIWHIGLQGLDLTGLHYGWRLDGDPAWEGRGRFDPTGVMLDPYSKLITELALPESARVNDTITKAYMGCLEQPKEWQIPPGSVRPRVPLEAMAAYEIEIRSFTQADEVPKEHRGKALGILDRLEMLKSMGITSVVLSPMYSQLPGLGPYGYAVLNYFAPDASISVAGTAAGAVDEFRQVVAGLHSEGIEVILQFDFTFTAEGTDDDPQTFSFRGIDCAMYYRGNGVLNCGQVMTRQMIPQILRHWQRLYQLDGFAILNAETFCQDSNSRVLDSPPLVESLSLDPILKSSKLIAYVGDSNLLPRGGERGFPHWGVWLQVNGNFASVSANYMACHGGLASAIATAVTGSADLLAARLDSDLPGCLAAGRRPGFSLNAFAPLVAGSPTLMEKAAAACGMSDVPDLKAHSAYPTLILPCHKALLVMQLMSQGVPVVSNPGEDPEIGAFMAGLLRLRNEYIDLIAPPEFHTQRTIAWHGARHEELPDWGGERFGQPASEVMAFSVGEATGPAVYVAFNPHSEPVTLELPRRGPTQTWAIAVDTSLHSPRDVPSVPFQVPNLEYFDLNPKSAVVLVAK